MNTWLLCPIIAVGSFLLSYYANRGTINILGRKSNSALLTSSITDSISWANFYIIGKITDWSIPLIVADIVGDVVGDWVVSKRLTITDVVVAFVHFRKPVAKKKEKPEKAPPNPPLGNV